MTATGRVDATATGAARVLVVDDEPQITRVLRTVLTSQGYQVRTAPEGESALVDFGGRRGFIRLAKSKGVTLVPVVAIGGQETALFLSRGERLAKLFGLDRMFRLKVLPISLALPWGLNIGDMLGHIPLPAKITIQVLEPIDVSRMDVDKAYELVTGQMQTTLTGLAEERGLPILG